LQFQRDKDFAWVIVFASFLVLVIASLVSAILQAPKRDVPQPIALASSTFEREFVLHTLQLVKYISLGTMALGAYGVFTWPSGPGAPRW
jgi:hypothetical protein